MNVFGFVSKWKKVALTERSAAQQHFLDLCAVFDHPTPAQADPTGDTFAFEKGVEKHGGGKGFADVWKRGAFAFEYKGRHKDLEAAYNQLLKYREALENPPLLVVCDMDRIIIRTNFTGTATARYEIALSEMDLPRNLEILRSLFHEPNRLRPGVTRENITKEAAQRLAAIAQTLRDRGLEAHDVARFLDRIIFCLFAEDVGLLPKDLFARVVANTRNEPGRFARQIGQLFAAMADGGDFGEHAIRWFNGSLFTDAGVLPLTLAEIEAVRQASLLDWGAVDPSILGTLFERGLDPDKRAQLGAHYTSREDIETLIEPVIMQPLRREWASVQASVEQALQRGTRPARESADRMLHDFVLRLGRVTVLDPACGSGNFLYIALQKLKDLEKEVLDFALSKDFSAYLPEVGPWQLYGIEINAYAHELAQMTVWIGYLQWLREHGYLITDNPVLRATGNIRCMDAVIDVATGTEPEWPAVDFIVGNPPFLGDKVMRRGLGNDYVETLRRLYEGRIPGQSDLCCYWFERARQQIVDGHCRRAGLLATQGIRGGANRESLNRIKEAGDIFFGVSDREWILDGANVHVSLIGFDDGKEALRELDGIPVNAINANLTSRVDVTLAHPLTANANIGFLGSCKGGSFDIPEREALQLLSVGGNVNGRPNSDVIRPVFNTEDLLQRTARRWIIDNAEMELSAVCMYERPHAIVEERVKPSRDTNRDRWLRENWWRPQRMRPAMRQRIQPLARFLVTTTTSKHRVFVWMHPPELPDHQLVVFARDDDYFFGVLHSRVHELWARAQGTQLRERESGFRYTPSTCFETFPLPEPTAEQQADVAAAALELDTLRNRWLNPPEWVREEVLEFPGAIDGPWARYVQDPDADGIGTVRYPRLVPRNEECAHQLASRTLTNLYNQRPAWLDMAHKRLDAAVYAAYGFALAITDEEILACLLALNKERSVTS